MTDYQLIGILSIDSYRMRYMEVLIIVLSFKSNKNEIEKFLQDMKNILEDESFNIHDNIKVVKSKKKEEKEKYSTPYTMVDLEYDDSDVVECLKDLTIKEYSETLVYKDNLEPTLLYVFGKDISNKQVYIKVKIKGDKAKYVLCVSFHYAEYEMSFPYFK